MKTTADKISVKLKNIPTNELTRAVEKREQDAVESATLPVLDLEKATELEARNRFGIELFSADLNDHPMNDFIRSEQLQELASEIAMQAVAFARKRPILTLAGAFVAGFYVRWNSKNLAMKIARRGKLK